MSGDSGCVAIPLHGRGGLLEEFDPRDQLQANDVGALCDPFLARGRVTNVGSAAFQAGSARSSRSGGRMFGKAECTRHAAMLFKCASLRSLGHQMMSGA